eukprot:8539325-Alexandrium_andersonii.AAC.1
MLLRPGYEGVTDGSERGPQRGRVAERGKGKRAPRRQTPIGAASMPGLATTPSSCGAKHGGRGLAQDPWRAKHLSGGTGAKPATRNHEASRSTANVRRTVAKRA